MSDPGNLRGLAIERQKYHRICGGLARGLEQLQGHAALESALMIATVLCQQNLATLRLDDHAGSLTVSDSSNGRTSRARRETK